MRAHGLSDSNLHELYHTTKERPSQMDTKVTSDIEAATEPAH